MDSQIVTTIIILAGGCHSDHCCLNEHTVENADSLFIVNDHAASRQITYTDVCDIRGIDVTFYVIDRKYLQI